MKHPPPRLLVHNVPVSSGSVHVRAAVRSALVIVPVNRAAPPVVTLNAIRSSVAVAVSTVNPRMAAPPVALSVPPMVALLAILKLPP